MQHVTAFSRPQTVPSVPAAAPKTNLWILSSWRDLILYVGTPLLLVPLFAIASRLWSTQDIYVFVAAFGAMGHHLPGMLRAYGDRNLFERFRWRFILAPVFLVSVCVAFYWWDLKGIILAVFFWGVWHGMMQTYGFCRIYDAKMGSFAALTRRIDFATCAIWFAAAVLLSRDRMTDTLEAFYASGGPFIPRAGLHAMQQTVFGVAVAVSVLFLGHFARMWIQGRRPNPVKVALLLTSISFWFYCNNGVTNILAGIALFEVFHDVQYLSLVWIYNRNRVEKDSTIGGFMRFVFRRSGSLVGLYIGLVFAYGALGFFGTRLQVDTMKRVLTGVVAASGLLHFYYDGFIWKMREKSTRESLGLTGGIAAAGAQNFLPSWMTHGLKWVAAFVIPLAALWVGQTRHQPPELQREAWVVEDFPTGASQRFFYAGALERVGQFAEAAEQFRVGLVFKPDDAQAHYGLTRVLLAQSNGEEAAQHFEEAIRLDPKNGGFHSDYAYVLEGLGKTSDAHEHHEAAIRLTPKAWRAHYNYALFLNRQFKRDEAIREFEASLQLQPDNADVESDLAAALYQKDDLDGAQAHYENVVRLDPNRAKIYNYLGIICMRKGDVPQAIARFKDALRVQPDYEDAAKNLELAEPNKNDQASVSSPR
jgi:tetratricopeptide (TPR) repeat protein